MPLVANKTRHLPQQKGLSSSRLRERRRESQELERVSSFFLPACPDATSRKVKPARPKDNEDNRCKKVTYRDNTISSATPSSPTPPTQGHIQQPLSSHEDPRSLPTETPSNPLHGSGSSSTMYITWSSSQPSPKAGKHLVDTRPRSIEPANSATPESIRRALIATRVYENTGIRSYDTSSYQQKIGHKSGGELTSTGGSIVDHVDTCEAQVSAEDQGSKMKSMCPNDAKDTAALLSNQEERWNTILHPQWKLRGLSDVEMSSADKQQNDEVTDIPRSVKPPSRQEMAQEARLNPMRESPRAQRACRHIDHNPDTNSRSTAEGLVLIPPEPERIIDQAKPADQDRDTITSRDAMPPPPLPPTRSNYPHLTNREPGDYVGSSMCVGATQPLDTHVHVPNHEHPQATNPYTATEQPHESGREHERVISTLDSVSWIPQTMTSSIVTHERDKTSSRLSMRSLIYETQGEEEDPHGDLRLTPQPKMPITESMADFITRIESEIEESTCLDEYCRSEPMTENQANSLDPETSTEETYNRQLIASDGSRIDYRQFPNHVADPEFKAASQTSHGFQGYEGQAGCLQEGTTTTTSEILKDDINDFLEMSNFWRPNRFSHF